MLVANECGEDATAAASARGRAVFTTATGALVSRAPRRPRRPAACPARRRARRASTGVRRSRRSPTAVAATAASTSSGQPSGSPNGVMPPCSMPVCSTAMSIGAKDALRASSRRRTTPLTSARVVARTTQAASRVSPPRRPATTTQFADTSSATSYRSQNAAVSASAGSISATSTSAPHGPASAGYDRVREQVGVIARGGGLQAAEHSARVRRAAGRGRSAGQAAGAPSRGVGTGSDAGDQVVHMQAGQRVLNRVKRDRRIDCGVGTG